MAATSGPMADFARLPPQRKALVFLVIGLLLVLGLGRSIVRQRDWKDNDVFVEALVRDAPLGYRAHFIRGRHYGQKGDLREMELEYRRAVRLFPYDAGMTLSIADAYTRAGLCNASKYPTNLKVLCETQPKD